MDGADELRCVCCYISQRVVSLQILLVSGSKHPDKWVVPGGGIEPTEDTGVAAVREAMEEAGVNGILGRFLGVFEVSFILMLGLNGCLYFYC